MKKARLFFLLFISLNTCFLLFAQDSVWELDETLLRFNAKLEWEPLTKTGTLRSGTSWVRFRVGDSGGFSLYKTDTIVRGLQPWLQEGRLRFPQEWIEQLGVLFDRDKKAISGSHFKVKAILIDPGHGGKDPGAIGNHIIDGKSLKVQEKDVTLAVGKSLYQRLIQAYPDKTILLTRSDDTYPSLDERVMMANKLPLASNEAIIFISIHCNASFNKNARGYEVWYLSPDYRRDLVSSRQDLDNAEILPIINDMLEEEFTNESVIIAQNMLHHFDQYLKNKIPSRGIKAEEWFVVKNAKMPSVLVELGFVTNKEDATLLTNPTYLNLFVQALYSGINDYIRSFESIGGAEVTE